MSTGEPPPTAGQLIGQIQLSLRELTARIHQLNDAVGDRVELRAADLEVLDLVARHGPMSPSELTTTTGIHPATLTGVIDRLEQGGWVARVPDPEDRRRIRVEARRDRGGELMRLYGSMNRSVAKLCSEFTPDQLVAIRDFLRGAAGAGIEAARRLRSSD